MDSEKFGCVIGLLYVSAYWGCRVSRVVWAEPYSESGLGVCFSVFVTGSICVYYYVLRVCAGSVSGCLGVGSFVCLAEDSKVLVYVSGRGYIGVEELHVVGVSDCVSTGHFGVFVGWLTFCGGGCVWVELWWEEVYWSVCFFVAFVRVVAASVSEGCAFRAATCFGPGVGWVVLIFFLGGEVFYCYDVVGYI